jgi:multidrug resistance efflux pump
VSLGTIEVTVPAVGRVGSPAGSEAKLAFAVAGRIAAVNVHVGQRVAAGDALATLDARPLVLAAQGAAADARVAAAQEQAARVDRTSTRIAVDRAAYERAQNLYAAGVVARKDVESARAQLAADEADAQTAAAERDSALAGVAGANARAAIAARDANNAVLRAPIDGVVTAVYHQPGESVDPTVSVVAVAPESSAQVTLAVSGVEAPRVHAGAPVRMTTNGRSVSGIVAGVSGAVDPITQTTQVLVRADVPSALSGTAVDARIVVGNDRGIIVPKSAVLSDPSTGKTLVFVRSRDKAGNPTFNERDVDVVFATDTKAEVTGLRPGEEIATVGAFELLPPSGGAD